MLNQQIIEKKKNRLNTDITDLVIESKQVILTSNTLINIGDRCCGEGGYSSLRYKVSYSS